MKGQKRENLKKWWVLVVVATLALSLTSCGKKNNRLMSGSSLCEGELGDFELVTLPYGRRYQLVLYVDYLKYDVDLELTFYNSETQDYNPFTVVRTSEGAQLTFDVPEATVYEYDELRITPVSSQGGNWNQRRSTDEAICVISFPGQIDGSY